MRSKLAWATDEWLEGGKQLPTAAPGGFCCPRFETVVLLEGGRFQIIQK